MAKDRVTLRAMQTIRRTSDDESKRTTGINQKWIIPGAGTAVFTTTRERADALIAAGHAVEIGADVRSVKRPVAPPKDDAPTEQALPMDFPYRQQLVTAGLQTVEAVATFPDLTEISGIGEAYAKRIVEHLQKMHEDEAA